MDPVRIGKFIKNLRQKNHLTQKELADQLGVTYQAVSKWENGKNIPDIFLLKKISMIYQVNMDELLNGAEQTKSKERTKFNHKWFLIGGFVFVILIVSCIIMSFHEKDFVFKTITSNCDEFELTGSAAYNHEKTSIYISNVNYCGQENNTIYQKFDCSLYEAYKNTTTKIASCGSSSGEMTLEEFLKDVQINVNNYVASCKMFTSSSLYLEIQATSENEKQTIYKIPIQLEENCNNKSN